MDHPASSPKPDSENAFSGRRFYFEPGLSMRSVCAGDEVRLLHRLEGLFGLRLIARENWVSFEGDSAAMERAEAFFAALSRLRLLRQQALDARDLELLIRSFCSDSLPGMEELWRFRVQVGPKKHDVLPRSRRQLEYLRAMRSKDVIFGVGPAGTGKTYLAMAMAVSQFLSGEVSRIVLTRPARESGERLGYLPGSLEEKVSPYLRPLYDALHEMMSIEEVQDLTSRGIIEIAPLAFMRGRTLNNAFIILDEAQNTTVDQMLMFLTRMGFGSRCVVTGDPMQSDLGRGERSGLEHAVRTLQKLPELGFVFFETGDVVRHALLEKIIQAYNTTPKTEDPV